MDDIRRDNDSTAFDYSHVSNPARLAVYDDMTSAPRVTEIPANETKQFISDLATATYEQSKLLGGHIPFSIINEVTENFIHAQFKDVVVSVFDGGNTIRFADQGPGIKDKEKAEQPGFSSASGEMKNYIRGVGSGLPIVKEYFDVVKGTISIEDNIESGSVITISTNPAAPKSEGQGRGAEAVDEGSSRSLLAPEQHTRYPDEGWDGSSYSYRERSLEREPYRERSRWEEERREQGYRSDARARRFPVPPLKEREKTILVLLLEEGPLGVTEVSKLADIPASSTHGLLQSLEQAGLIEHPRGEKKRYLTEYGRDIASLL